MAAAGIVGAGVLAAFLLAVSTNPKAPAPGECVEYALYNTIQKKGDCN